VLSLSKLHSDKVFILKTDSHGNAIPGLQECSGIAPLPRDGRLYPGVLQGLRDGGCELLVSVDYERTGLARLKQVLLNLYADFRNFRVHGVSPSKLCVVLFCDGVKELLENFSADEDDMVFLKQFMDLNLISEKFNSATIEPILRQELTSESNIDPEVAHCFQSVVVTDETEFEPMQLVCVVKHFARRKLNSRMWFFKGFCEAINPKYCIVINSGVLPSTNAVWSLYRSLEYRPEVGVVVGEVLPEAFDSFSILQTSYAFRQTTLLKLNRYLEDVIGAPCISNCLFIGFRWDAIRGVPLKQSLTDLYSPSKQSPYHINKLSCGDSLLALSAVLRKGSRYTYAYEQTAKAKIALPDGALDYIKHRRSQVRAELFQFFESLRRWKKDYDDENPCKKGFQGFLMLYFCLKFAFLWSGSALTVVITSFPINELAASFGLDFAADALSTLYCFVVFLVVLVSLSSHTLTNQAGYKAFIVFFSLHLLAACLSFAYCLVFLGLFLQEFILLCVWLTGFILTAAVTKDLSTLPLVSLQHFVLIPTETNLVTVSVFCSLSNFYYSDWLSKAVSHRFTINEEFQLYRTYVVLMWSLTNWTVFHTLKHGNHEIDFTLMSGSTMWYMVLGTLVTLDLVKLLLASKHLCTKRLETPKDNVFFVTELPKAMNLEDSGEELVEGQPEPGVDDLMRGGSMSDDMAEELDDSSELDLSIQSLDFKQHFPPREDLTSFSGVSSVRRGPESRFISRSISIREL
jgi:hypothetical protein